MEPPVNQNYGLFTANMTQLLENKGVGLLWLITAYSQANMTQLLENKSVGLLWLITAYSQANMMQLLENAIHH